MVRRWSFINSLNVHYNPLFDSKRQSTFGVTVKSTMYFRKPYSVPSVLSRRRWSRRKHLYGWLPLSNVIKTWAQTYRFHKNYLKATTRAHFTKSSFLAFNLVSLKNTVPSKYKGSELIISSSLPRKILRYFSAFSNPRLKSLLSFRNINLSFNSTLPSVVMEEESFITPYTVMFSYDSVKAFSVPSVEPKQTQRVSLQLLDKLFFQIFQLSLVTAKFFYRLLILLVIARKL
jgi:hypothetical protein